MTHVTGRLTAKNRDQLRNPTLGNRVRATFTFFAVFFRWIKIYIKPLDRSNASWAGQMYRLIQIPKLFSLWKNKLTYSDSILAAVYIGASGQTERATNLNICTSRQHWQMSATPLAHGITIGPLTIAFSASGGKSNELPPKVPIYKISLSYDLS